MTISAMTIWAAAVYAIPTYAVTIFLFRWNIFDFVIVFGSIVMLMFPSLEDAPGARIHFFLTFVTSRSMPTANAEGPDGVGKVSARRAFRYLQTARGSSACSEILKRKNGARPALGC